ncbi:hypothetical protein AGLY_013989, partial [Aphis glycines]
KKNKSDESWEELLVFGTSSQNKIIKWFVCCRDDEIQSTDRWTRACTSQKSIKYSITQTLKHIQLVLRKKIDAGAQITKKKLQCYTDIFCCPLKKKSSIYDLYFLNNNKYLKSFVDKSLSLRYFLLEEKLMENLLVSYSKIKLSNLSKTGFASFSDAFENYWKFFTLDPPKKTPKK